MIKCIEIQPKGLGLYRPQDWRQWLNGLTLRQHDLLHNHKPEGGEIYRYPLVQYHAWGIRGFQDGAELLLSLLPLLQAEADLELYMLQHEAAMLDTPKQYQLKRWQPFNSENYALWNKKNGLRDRIEILERILVGNVLGACRALGFEIPNKGLQIRLLENLGDMGFQRFSSQNAELHRLTFNIRWEANIDLPDGIGLGRGVSKGYGNLEKVRERARVGIKKGEREKISLEAIR